MITFNDIVAESSNFKALVTRAKKFAASDGSILLTGPSGTGKSFLAEAIHSASLRKDRPFVKINCANLSPELLESELFGHEKGSFTGATTRKIGKFEAANTGTIFLDEVGEMSMTIQSKLLRVVEDRKFERVGGTVTIPTNVRIIAATNNNLVKSIENGSFREDLLFRINVLPLSLIPLCERPECLERLSMIILNNINKSRATQIKGFTKDALSAIKSYSWPGNIRQLKNVIERAIILAEGEYIGPGDLMIDYNMIGFTINKPNAAPASLDDYNKSVIIDALESCNWSQKLAAQKLGISPRAMNYKVKKFGITSVMWRTNR